MKFLLLSDITVQAQWAVLAIASLAVSGKLYASSFEDHFIDPKDGKFDASNYLAEKAYGFLPVPIIITEPAVGNGLGLVGVFFHESKDQRAERKASGAVARKSIVPENVTAVGIAATENGTRAGGIGHLGFWREDTLRYTGALLYSSVNLDFYSLGGVELPQPLELNINGPVVYQEFKGRIGKSDWFIGARQIYSRIELSTVKDIDQIPGFPGLNERLQALLQQTITTSGLGLVMEYDSRNSPFNPETGYNYRLHYTTFDEAIGSDINYDAYNLTALNYWELSQRFYVGLRIQYDGVSVPDDEVLPPYLVPGVVLRGIPAARYQGNQVVVGEAQLNWKYTPRWIFSLFGGQGRTADSFSDLSAAEGENSYGIGFRYLIARRYNMVIGVDIAKGPEETAFYIQAGSPW